ncbi:MAG: hypothetical protein ACHP6I_01685 [Rickettsiales bacterium]
MKTYDENNVSNGATRTSPATRSNSPKLPDSILSTYPTHEPTNEQVYGHAQGESPTYLREDGSAANRYLRRPKNEEKTGIVFIDNSLIAPDFANGIPTHRAVEPIGLITPNSKTTLKVQTNTPCRTTLFRSSTFGPFTTYSSHALEEVTNCVNNSETKEPVNLVPPNANFKEQSIRITFDDLVRGRRSSSQQAIMATHGTVRAEDAARTAGIYQTDDVWHWMHLIAYKFGGEAVQRRDNLVAGTEQANTTHRILEMEIANHIKLNLDEVRVTAVADCNEYHVSSLLQYRIQTSDFDITFVINTQTRNKPSSIDEQYVHMFLSNLAKIGKRSLEEISENETLAPSHVDRLNHKRMKFSVDKMGK